MNPQLPDYYRQFAERPTPRKPGGPPGAPPAGPKAAPPVAPPTVPFRADRFTLSLYDDWQDKTIYILAGPAVDDVQHNVTITFAPKVGVDRLIDFADWQVKSLEENLKGCRLLKQDQVQLACGLPAYRALFVWWPTEELRLYQEQLYVLHDGAAYTLTAAFTRKTRKTLGPKVERIMMSFDPTMPQAPAPPQRPPPRRF